MPATPTFRDDSGQTLVLAALAMVLLIGFLGLAIDVGQLRFAHRRLQAQADAAALAAALEIPTCNGVSNCAAMQAAGSDSVTSNGLSAATIITACAPAGTPGATLTLNNPPCSRGSADVNSGNPAYVEVIVTKPESMHFASAFGPASVTLTAHAEAGAKQGSSTSSSAAAVLVQ